MATMLTANCGPTGLAKVEIVDTAWDWAKYMTGMNWISRQRATSFLIKKHEKGNVKKLNLIPEVRTQSLLWPLTLANIEVSVMRMDYF